MNRLKPVVIYKRKEPPNLREALFFYKGLIQFRYLYRLSSFSYFSIGARHKQRQIQQQ